MTNFKYDTYTNEYLSIEDATNNGNISIFKYIFTPNLTEDVEIIEEEKKIPEKSNIDFNTKLPVSGCSENEAFMMTCISHLGKTIDSLIDYLKSKGE